MDAGLPRGAIACIDTRHGRLARLWSRARPTHEGGEATRRRLPSHHGADYLFAVGAPWRLGAGRLLIPGLPPLPFRLKTARRHQGPGRTRAWFAFGDRSH